MSAAGGDAPRKPLEESGFSTSLAFNYTLHLVGGLVWFATNT